MTVSFSDSGLTTMGYEKKMIREDDVKFGDEDGILELTDVRLVWYKKPGKSIKKFAALAGAVAGAALLEGIGSRAGGIGGHAMRSVGRGLGAAAVFSAVSSWTQDSFVNKDANGRAQSIALPLVAFSQAQAMGKTLVLPLKSGGDMRFEFKHDKVIPAFMANINSAQQEGKCPYCGAPSRGLSSCSQCGAPLQGGGGGPAQRGPVGGTTITITGQPTERGGFCPNCGQPVRPGASFCDRCGQRL
ncbi:MAG: hypothetical protein C4K47_01695 [Candidatus Thorarchaeota archaeon]|nr:MAG: hypothetical protein C4K47_01695 [Candidatus Thorarchaeota archaeon]